MFKVKMALKSYNFLLLPRGVLYAFLSTPLLE